MSDTVTQLTQPGCAAQPGEPGRFQSCAQSGQVSGAPDHDAVPERRQCLQRLSVAPPDRDRVDSLVVGVAVDEPGDELESVQSQQAEHDDGGRAADPPGPPGLSSQSRLGVVPPSAMVARAAAVLTSSATASREAPEPLSRPKPRS